MSRRFARELVLKIAFQMNFDDEDNLTDIASTVENYRELDEEPQMHELNDNDRMFVKDILKGIEVNKAILDQKINEHLVNWTIDRLNILDAAMLRIAAYEILFLKDTPKAIIINEALNLVARFGDEKSTKYINAVLDNIDNDEA
jgi:N utilization substance protein B